MSTIFGWIGMSLRTNVAGRFLSARARSIDRLNAKSPGQPAPGF
jgi:hypothetical protein